MNYFHLGDEYMRQSVNIHHHIEKLKLDMNNASLLERRDIKRRISMLYELAFEMRCTANRLKGGYSNDYKLYS